MGFSRRGASQRAEIGPFRAMDVLSRALALEAAGRDIVHMEIGQPASAAPAAARAALAAALDQPLGYTAGLGRDDLRAAIAALYARWYGLRLDPARVVVTAGSSAAFQLAFLALFDVGQRVAIADPGYPSYRNILSALGLEAVRIAADREAAYQPTPAQVAHAASSPAGLHGLLLASPANPTGGLLGRAELTDLITEADAVGAAVISDEIYHGLHYAERAVSALEITDDAIVINSFSKYFAMTGWRIGWMIAPESLTRTLERLAQNLFICASHPAQVAALGALRDEAVAELEANRRRYAANRAHLAAELPKAGIVDFAPAGGAFYLYFTLPEDVREDSAAWCARLLDEAGVAATPGLDFDLDRGGRTVRLSFAGDEARIAEGARRIVAWRSGRA